jgi:peptidoglycan/xylan/chitin deacetylase (PgdA/CDA1 family)
VEKKFFLTFDGAPNPPQTDVLLERLARYEIKATFFMEGWRLENEPDCGKRVLAGGHALGNHSFSHPDFSGLNFEEQKEEILRCGGVLQKVLGVKTKFVRPPWGKIADETREWLAREGYSLILWDYSVKDWEGPDARAIAGRILDGLKADHAVIVIHDRVEWNPEVLDIIVPEIKKRGYTFCKYGGD